MNPNGIFRLLLILSCFTNEVWAELDEIALIDKAIENNETLRMYLKNGKFRIETSPDNLRIGKIIVVTNEVFDQYDIIPDFPNYLHIVTVESVVREELTLGEGEVFLWDTLNESVRNLYTLSIFSLAVIIPIEAENDQMVDILVFTKDLWSLRAENDLSIEGIDNLQYLYLSLTERNFLGLNKMIALFGELQIDSYNIGQYFVADRVFGSDYRFSERGKLNFRRKDFGYGDETKSLDGEYIWLNFGKPLRNIQSRYGFSLDLSYSDIRRRLFVGKDLSMRKIETDSGVYLLPEIFKTHTYTAQLSGLRSFGDRTTLKNDFELGVDFSSLRYNTESSLFADIEDPLVLAKYEKAVLPYSEDQAFPFISWKSFEPKYQKFFNIQTFAIAESLRIGYTSKVQIDLARKFFGSDNDFLRASLDGSYRGTVGSDYYLLMSAISARYQDGEIINRYYVFGAKNVFPEFLGGRVHCKVGFVVKSEYLDNSIVTLGGSATGLRGVVTNLYRGKKKLMTNIEYRSSPFVFRGLHYGYVVFHDGGDVFDNYDEFSWKASIGAGVRLLFPQFNVEPLRIDLAFPYYGENIRASYLSVAYSQLF